MLFIHNKCHLQKAWYRRFISNLTGMETIEEQLTFIFSFFPVCACSRLVVASASFGNSVSASSVPNACRVCAVVFTIRANASIACREGNAALKTWISQCKREQNHCDKKLFVHISLKRHERLKLSSVYWTYGYVSSYSAVWDPAFMAVLLRSSQLRRQLSWINVGMELSHWTQHYHLKKHNRAISLKY